MHLDEEQIQRLVDHELSRSEEAVVREHLPSCSDCRRRAAEAEEEAAEVSGLLSQLDQPVPSITAAAVVARAQAGSSARARDSGRTRDFGPLRWAAGILLALGAVGAAYAVPGSPLPGWVGAVTEWIEGRPDPARVVPPRAPIADPGGSGIAVAPGRELLILFTSPQAEGRARVTLTDGAEVVVRGPIGAATFTSADDRLVIDNRGTTATFEIQIPRTAPRVEIRTQGKTIFLKEGTRVTTAESEDGGGRYSLPLAPSGG